MDTLNEQNIEEVQRLLAARFANFADFTVDPRPEENYSLFRCWVAYSPDDRSLFTYFVTLELNASGWRAFLTTGQPGGYWTSADYDDAHLLNTDDPSSLSEAITDLKTRMAKLFETLSSERIS